MGCLICMYVSLTPLPTLFVHTKPLNVSDRSPSELTSSLRISGAAILLLLFTPYLVSLDITQQSYITNNIRPTLSPWRITTRGLEYKTEEK